MNISVAGRGIHSLSWWVEQECWWTRRLLQAWEEAYVVKPRDTAWNSNHWYVCCNIVPTNLLTYSSWYYCGILLVSVKSFVELIRYIFTVPGVKVFLSEKISQDPLEKFFGCQRQRGAVNDNPNVQQFCYNTRALRTITSIRPDVKGNCCGLKRAHTIDWQKENVPLPKRQKPRKVVNSPVNLC